MRQLTERVQHLEKYVLPLDSVGIPDTNEDGLITKAGLVARLHLKMQHEFT